KKIKTKSAILFILSSFKVILIPSKQQHDYKTFVFLHITNNHKAKVSSQIRRKRSKGHFLWSIIPTKHNACIYANDILNIFARKKLFIGER
ncbi:MAG: hypothetical protein IKO34_12480, partial [Bacteroidales bacterium]|nr:hypothetical protein [Bacteroidales bacterium]